MFERLLFWIKGVLTKMFGPQNIRTALSVDVSISNAMTDAISTWAKMYINEADWLNNDIKSLNLAAAIASEIARSATIEMEVTIDGSPRADYLAAQMGRLLPKMRQIVEYGAAKGGVVLKPYAASGQIAVDVVHADQFFPVEFDPDGNITSAVFVDQRKRGDNYYTRLEYHAKTERGIEVRNVAFMSQAKDTLGTSVPLGDVREWADIEPEALITGVDRPLYAYFKMPLANNIDPNSPLGVSAYSRAVDLIEQADRQWSDLLWEFDSGRRAIYVDALAFGKDDDGNPILPNRRLYRTLNMSGNLDDEDMFKDWTPSLREENILRGLDAILKRIEYTCGLAYGTLSDPNQVDKTATEIAASKQRSQATVVDTQKSLHDALEQLIWAIDTWATLANLAPRGTYSVVYEFDDSLVVDSELQMAQDRQTVSLGAMPKWMFLVRNYGLDENTAKQWITDATAEQPQDDMFGPGV